MGEQSEKTPLLTGSAEPATASRVVEASATNQEALAAAPAGTDITSASAPQSSVAQEIKQGGMQR